MDVLNRWRRFENDSFYSKLLDLEIKSLAEKIFGKIHGIERIYGSFGIERR